MDDQLFLLHIHLKVITLDDLEDLKLITIKSIIQDFKKYIVFGRFIKYFAFHSIVLKLIIK